MKLVQSGALLLFLLVSVNIKLAKGLQTVKKLAWLSFLTLSHDPRKLTCTYVPWARGLWTRSPRASWSRPGRPTSRGTEWTQSGTPEHKNFSLYVDSTATQYTHFLVWYRNFTLRFLNVVLHYINIQLRFMNALCWKYCHAYEYFCSLNSY